MSLETAMKVDPFSGREKGKSPELVDQIEAMSDPLVEHVFEIHGGLDHDASIDDQIICVSQLKMDVLTPTQIEGVLQKIIRSGRERYGVSPFLSRLIQDSYDAGHNGFVLTTYDTQIEFLGQDLTGSSERKIEVNVKGNVGDFLGDYSAHCVFAVEGSVKNWCGYHSGHNVFTIEGNAGNSCGCLSEYSTFIIEGNIGSSCGEDSRYGRYASSNPLTYEKMKEMVPTTNEVSRLK